MNAMNANAMKPAYLSCTEIRQLQRKGALTQAEVPTEHAVSFPLPTRRSGRPGYAFFASPAVRLAGQPMMQGAPDRWWILQAQSGRVEIYALSSAQKFSEVAWASQQIQPAAVSLAALRAAIARLEDECNQLAPAFFAGTAINAGQRASLKQAIEAAIPAPLLPQYQELVPDFFAWLISEAAPSNAQGTPGEATR